MTVLDDVALDPEEFCGFIFGQTCGHVYNPLGNWSVPLPLVPKPPVTPPHLPKVNTSFFKKTFVEHVTNSVGFFLNFVSLDLLMCVEIGLCTFVLLSHLDTSK